MTLVSTSDGREDLVERRALTALWELDYLGSPTTETIATVLGGRYTLDRVEAALSDAEADGLALRSTVTEDGRAAPDWRRPAYRGRLSRSGGHSSAYRSASVRGAPTSEIPSAPGSTITPPGPPVR